MPQQPAVPEAAWINKPRAESTESKASVQEQEVMIPGVPEHGQEGDHRSCGNLEAAAFDRLLQHTGNYTKFELQVSQNH